MKVKDILKTEGIIKFSSDDKLSKVLSHLSSSHDCAFVFDKDKFIGVINPYYTLIKNSFPANSKVSNCIISPPKLQLEYSLEKAARLMMESKIHYLPVFNSKKEFVGIVSARRILRYLLKNKNLSEKISPLIRKKKQLITVLSTDTASKCLSLFKKEKISKLIVVDANDRLRGIITYYDLINFLSVPKRRVDAGDRKGNKVPFLHLKVKNFMKRMVLTVDHSATFRDIVSLILDKGIGSVVVVSKDNKPLAIFTTKDVISHYLSKENKIDFRLIFQNISHSNLVLISPFVKQYQNVVNKLRRVEKSELVIKEEKRGGLFKIFMTNWFKGGEKEHIKRETKNLKKGLLEIKKVVKELDKKVK